MTEQVRVGHPGPLTKPEEGHVLLCHFHVWQQLSGQQAHGEVSCCESKHWSSVSLGDTQHPEAPSLSCRGPSFSPASFPVLQRVWGMAEFRVQQRGPWEHGWALREGGLSQSLAGWSNPRAFLCCFCVPSGFSLAWFRAVSA